MILDSSQYQQGNHVSFKINEVYKRKSSWFYQKKMIVIIAIIGLWWNH